MTTSRPDRRRCVRLVATRRRVGREQRRRDRRRRRAHDHRHADGAIAMGTVRGCGRRSSVNRSGDCSSRTRTSTTSAAPRRSRTQPSSAHRRRASCSTARCPSVRTRRSCPRSTTSSTTSPSSAHVRSHTSSPTRRSSTPRIEVLPATGHTAGDLMALVADVDVLFAGDLCFFGVTPLAFQGDPKMWADVLDAVAELADGDRARTRPGRRRGRGA